MKVIFISQFYFSILFLLYFYHIPDHYLLKLYLLLIELLRYLVIHEFADRTKSISIIEWH